ncbi:MAG: hypothetical protein AAB586_01910 [Patescibacteria group bacterium]
MTTRKMGGFTILEILLALLLITLAVSIITVSFSKLNSSQVLDKSTDLIISIMDEARSLTLSSKDDTQYGVYLGESQIVLFKGSMYSALEPSNVTTDINHLVGMRNIVLSGGGASVVFKRLTGNTDEAGVFEVFLRSSPTTFRTITIRATGVVESN